MAQTFSIPDYASLHNDLDTFFIDQQSLVGEPPVITAEMLPIKVTTEENVLLRNVLSQMIRWVKNCLQYVYWLTIYNDLKLAFYVNVQRLCLTTFTRN